MAVSEKFSLCRLDSQAPDFLRELDALLAWDLPADDSLEQTVRAIINEVRRRGDKALVEYTNHFDKRKLRSATELILPKARLDEALAIIAGNERDALTEAAARIRAFHEHQKQTSWSYTEADGTMLGQQITPLDRVGVYVPGGKAAYPSSVLMGAIPAQVAGVGEIIMVMPTPGGEANDLALAAAGIAGVDRVYTLGGAQAVAALAYGTKTIPRVDKVVGPGNRFVATAKRLVFGAVGIDMVAGPSEILILADGSVPPDWIAMDLFSQAEHDEAARAILISPNADYLDRVEAEIQRLLPGMERAGIIRASLAANGALLKVRDVDEGLELVNRMAPEHLELALEDADSLAPQVRNAGAIFIGRHTAEVLGDYCAGPNHVLPTASTARFSSPLGVYDFQKRTSLIQCSPQGADRLGRVAVTLARGEGLTAHARSAELRLGAAEEESS